MFASHTARLSRSFVVNASVMLLLAAFVLAISPSGLPAQNRFVQVPHYPAGGSLPILLAQEDLNGDGALDLIVMNINKTTQRETVSLLLGTGKGGFQAPKTMAYFPVSYGKPMAADVNRDSHLDLIFSSGNPQVIRVYLGQGEGFQQNALVSKQGACPNLAACHPLEMHAADFNGDGNPDLLTLLMDENGETALYLVLGNGTGSFRSPRALSEPGPLTTGNFNRDNILDIAVATYYGFKVFLGNGDGTFREGVSQYLPGNVAGSIGQLISADLRGNGKTDLIIVTSLTAEQSWGNCRGGDVAVVLGNGDGTFSQTVSSYATGDWTQGAIVTDMNGDHRPDLVVTNQLSGSYSVLLNAGLGKFATAVSYRTPETLAGDFLIGDFNGDGRPDLAVSTPTGVEVLRNSGGGQLFAPVSVAHFGPFHPGTTYAADVNHDGIPDLVGLATWSFDYGNCSSYGLYQSELVVTSQKGQPFASIGDLEFPFYETSDIGLGDFDHDGSLEIFALGRPKYDFGSWLTVQRIDGTLAFPYFEFDSWSNSGIVGDFNRDGFADVALEGDVTQMLLGDGKGNFNLGKAYPPGVSVARDINGDGKLDLIGTSGGAIQVMLGNGDGTFKTPARYPIAQESTFLTLADFNRDGKPDIAVGGGSEISLLLNNGNGTFKPAVNYPAGGPVSTIAAINLNGDGNAGVLVADKNDNKLLLLAGDGKGHLSPSVNYYPGGGGPQGLTVADFNGDGSPDVAVADSITNSYMILYNTGGTAIKVTASNTRPLAGQPVTFTATVAPSLAGSGKPNGTLAFKDGSTTLSTVPLVGGKASFSTSTLSRGTHTIQASYYGNTSFNPHLSAGVSVTVQ